MEQFAGVFHCFHSFSIAVLNYPKGITRAVGFYMALSMAEKNTKYGHVRMGNIVNTEQESMFIEVTTNFIIVT